MSFIAELKRRKVFRIAGAYLVAAWVVLQVASTLAPALELPLWTVKFVAVLAIVGFPFTLILGYIFDLTPGGVERTSDAATFHFPVRAAMVGTLIVLTGVVGFLVVRRRLNAAGLDPNSVVVLPFRVSGDPSLAAMDEGMVDLIAPKLTGVGGPRAVDSRTTLSAWRRVDSESDDITPRDAIKLARKLKASQVILGEVVATPGAIALNARVYSTIDGAASDPAKVRTTRDSLLNGIDQLVTELLSRQAGEGEHLSALLTSSLPAVQAYLDGNRLYRLGKYEDAAKSFATATDLDSTFALAAYGEVLSRSWAGFGPRYGRATRLAFNFKDKLPPRERALIVARVGDAYPKAPSYTAAMRGWEAVSTQYPDSPEMWYELGDHYYHYGQPLGMEDYEARALQAWEKAIALDSSFAPPWEHQVQIHAARGDTARLRAVHAKLASLKPDDNVRVAVDWVYATATRDRAMRARLIENIKEWPRSHVTEAIVATTKAGLSPVGLDTLMNHFLSTASTDGERFGAANYATSYELARGRPSRAYAHLDAAARLPDFETVALNNILLMAILYPEVGVERPAEARRKLAGNKNAGIACTIGLWDAFNKSSEEVAKAMQLLRDSITARPDGTDFLRSCAQVIRAADAVMKRQSNARAELQRADSLMIDGPLMGAGAANVTATVMSRLYEQIRDFEKARQAAARGGYAMFGMSAQTLEHARMAARTGRREEAIRGYRTYLAMRDNPEPGLAKEMTDKVRAELATLTSR